MAELRVIIIVLFLITAAISIIFGYSMAAGRIDEKTKETAFNEAKAEYLAWFHEKYTAKADAAASAVNQALLDEVQVLRKENKLLKELLQEKEPQ